MSHFTCTVALPGHIDPDALWPALEYALSPFNENMEVEPYPCDCDDPDHPMSTYNPDSQWDWWVVGGRWGGYWSLKPSADRTEDVGIATQESAFGMAEGAEKDDTTDSARIRAIWPESMTPTFAYLDLDGKWHESGTMGWFGQSCNNRDAADWEAEYLGWLQSMSEDTWVILCDLHI